MPFLINQVLIVSFVVAAVVVIVDAIASRRFSNALRVETIGLVIAFFVLHWTTGFPTPRQSFSTAPSVLAILAIFLFIVCGMAANYFFYLKSRFSWLSLLKPLCVSPIVMLPLIGTLETRGDTEPIQIICLALLSFQNGFFWKTVFAHENRESSKP